MRGVRCCIRSGGRGERGLRGVPSEDPTCAIAAWGFASILMYNPFAGVGAAEGAERAQAAIDKGRQMKARQRDRDYLEAVAAYYEDFANRPERQRALARSKAYRGARGEISEGRRGADLQRAVPRSPPSSSPTRPYSASLKAAAILEKQFAKYPNHPGVAHYLIHSYDAPPIAPKGLPAARRYAEHRARRAARAAHALAHLHARRRLAGFGDDQPPLGRRRAEGQRTRRRPARAWTT